MYLPGVTASGEAPAPPRSILSNVNPLQLDIPSKQTKLLRQQSNRIKNSRTSSQDRTNKPRKKLLRYSDLNITPPHLLLALRARDLRRENTRLDLRLDPVF